MFTIQQSVTIARPVEEVFAFLADPASIPRWRPDVLEARSGGPLQAGSEFDEVLNFGGRKTQTFRPNSWAGARRGPPIPAIASQHAPAPIANSARPSVSQSSVATAFASIGGGRSGRSATSGMK